MTSEFSPPTSRSIEGLSAERKPVRRCEPTAPSGRPRTVLKESAGGDRLRCAHR